MSKKITDQLWQTIAKGALVVSVFNAKITCLGLAHQPKLPNSVKYLRNF